MPFVTIASEKIFYATHGAGPAVVYIHGSGGTHKVWLHQLHNVPGVANYALDLPGHGRSEGTGRQTVADYSAVIVGLLDGLGLHKATLVGHSLGGAVALWTALQHPPRVAGLGLVGTGARLRVLPAILQGVKTEFAKTVELVTGYDYAENAPRELIEEGKREFLANTPEVLHSDFAACDAFDVMARLGEIRCPSLILCGAQDRLTPPKYSTYLQERIAGARLVLVPDAGHMVMVEKPDEVTRAIAEFVSGGKR